MIKEIIYEKQFSNINLLSFEEYEKTYSQCEEKTEPMTYEQIIETLYKDIVYIIIPDRAERSELFIRKAIEIADLYKISIRIEKYLSHISVNFNFYCGVGMKCLIDIIKDADEISFFKSTTDDNIILSLDFYTHAEYRKGRKINP